MGFQVGVKIGHPLRAQGIQALFDGRIIFFPKRDRRIFKQHAVALFVLLQRIGRALLFGDVGDSDDDPREALFMTGRGNKGQADIDWLAGQGLVDTYPAKPGVALSKANQLMAKFLIRLRREDLGQAAQQVCLAFSFVKAYPGLIDIDNFHQIGAICHFLRVGFQVGVKIGHPLRAQSIQALLDG